MNQRRFHVFTLPPGSRESRVGHRRAAARRGRARADTHRQAAGAGAQAEPGSPAVPGRSSSRQHTARRAAHEQEQKAGGWGWRWREGRAGQGVRCPVTPMAPSCARRWLQRGALGAHGAPACTGCAPAAVPSPTLGKAGARRAGRGLQGALQPALPREELLPCARGLLPAEPGSPPPRSGRHSGTGCSAQRRGLGTQAMLLRVGTGAKQQGVHNGLASPTPAVSAGQPCLAAPPCHLTSQPFTWPSQSPLLGKVHPSPCPTARLRPGFPRRTRLPALLQPSPPPKPLGSMPPSPQPS